MSTGIHLVKSPATEKHYRVKELAALWRYSLATITRLFSNEQGVLKLTTDTGKRKYVVLSIPESVASRVHARLSETLSEDGRQTKLARSSPLRVIRLRDLHTGVPKQTRNVIHRHTGDELADCKRVA